MADKIRVLLAENHTIVREGLRQLLETTGRIDVVGEAAEGQAALSLAEELQPDVAVLDLSMPVMDGIEATRRIRQSTPEVRVVVLTMHSTEGYIRAALKAGASGYLVKETATQDLLAAIEAAMRDEVYLSPVISRVLVDKYVKVPAEAPGGADVLSGREQEVLVLLARGHTNSEAADLLFISEKTVSTHRANLMRKLNLHNMSELVRYALRENLIDLDESDM